MTGFVYNGGLLNRIAKMWPSIPFSMGIHPETRRHCIFVYDAFERGSNIPAVGAKMIAAIEVDGSSEKDMEVLFTKLTMVCG
jgi:hypothetical protein